MRDYEHAKQNILRRHFVFFWTTHPEREENLFPIWLIRFIFCSDSRLVCRLSDGGATVDDTGSVDNPCELFSVTSRLLAERIIEIDRGADVEQISSSISVESESGISDERLCS